MKMPFFILKLPAMAAFAITLLFPAVAVSVQNEDTASASEVTSNAYDYAPRGISSQQHSGIPAAVMISGDEPSPPLNLHAESDLLKVILSWDAPLDSGSSPIAGYRIYRAFSTENWSLVSESGLTSAYIDTVPEYGHYRYAISAVNSDGWESAKSNEAPVNVSPPKSFFTITGRILINGKQPVPNVTVYLDSTDNHHHDETSTNSDGIYIFQNVPVGKSYVISLTIPGCPTYQSDPVLGSAGSVVINNIESTLPLEPPHPKTAALLQIIIIGSAAAVSATSFVAVYVISESFRYAFLSYLFLPFYTRLRRERVLDHFIRGQIFDYIRHHPGVYYNAIRLKLRLTNGTLTHHLRTLELQGFIKSKNDGINRRYYEISVKTDIGEGIAYSRLQREIIQTIKNAPGMSQTEIAYKLGIPLSVLNYNVKELIKNGTVRAEKRGRKQHCYLSNAISIDSTEPLHID